MQAKPTASTIRQDPFNWPSMGRADLMNLDKLSQTKDIVETRTMNMRLKARIFSNNLECNDIEGTFSSKVQ